MNGWTGTRDNRSFDTGHGPILYHLNGMTGLHLIQQIRDIQERHPGLRISGNAMLIVAEPDQLELFEAKTEDERWDER